MTITQTVKVPENRWISFELSRTVPSGIMANININIPFTAKDAQVLAPQMPNKIDEIRQLIQKEMAEKNTTSIRVESGDGWGAHVMEQYAQS
ncbi:MAG: hypothetical protein LBU88_06270 [Treponema sp.]|jgi:hypothetical protein|nr:hypothetical protein [Treponema sp.]